MSRTCCWSRRGPPGDADGVSLFAVPRGAAGLSVRGYPLYDGSGGAEVTLEGVLLPDDALLGGEGLALPAIALAYDRGAAAVCVEAVGAIQALHDLMLDYLKTRRQFGRPIGEFQVLQHRMVDLRMAVEVARSMALAAIAAIVEDRPTGRGRSPPPRSPSAAPRARSASRRCSCTAASR